MKSPRTFNLIFFSMSKISLVCVSKFDETSKNNTNPCYLNYHQQSLKFCFLNPPRSLRCNYDRNHETSHTALSSSFICQLNPCTRLHQVSSFPEKIPETKILHPVYGIIKANEEQTPALHMTIKMWYFLESLKRTYCSERGHSGV